MVDSVFRGGRSLERSVLSFALLACIAITLAGCGGITGVGDAKSSRHILSSLVISPTNPTVAIGDSERFAITGVFADGISEDVSSTVIWTSANPDVATINSAGIAESKQSGTTRISVRSGSVNATTILTVPAATLVSITIEGSSFSVPQGGTQQLAATASFTDGSKKDVTSSCTWASSDASIAAVSSSGVVTASILGTTTVTATSGVIRGAQVIRVSQSAFPHSILTALAISPASISLAKGNTQQLAVTGTFSDGSTADVTSTVAWALSPANLATISNTGMLSATATGTVMITASSGSISGLAMLTTVPPALNWLTIAPQNPTIAKGATLQLTATGSFSDGTSQTISSGITWSSSAPNVAVVSSAGVLSGTGNGKAIITAASGQITVSQTVTISSVTLVAMSISPANPTLAKGLTQQLSVTGSFSDGSKRDVTATVVWAVSPSAALSVSTVGVINTKAVGAATVIATSGTVSATDNVTVNPAALISFAISPANPSIPKGETQQLTAIGTYTDGTTQDITKQVTWSSSTASVTVNGTGLLTAATIGPAIITGAQGSITASDPVAVLAPVVVSIAVTPAKASITPDQTLQFQATGTFSDGATQDLTSTATWAATQTDIATVSNAGLATPAQLGKTAITATSGSVTGTSTLSVNRAILRSIDITPAAPSIPLGEAEQLIATGSYNDGSTQNLTREVTWASSQPTVATVSTTGAGVGKQVGNSTISATMGSISSNVVFTVTAPTLVGIIITPAHPFLPMPGSVQLMATGTFSDQTLHDITSQVTWSVSPANIVAVSNSGLGSAKAAGAVTITATSSSATANVTVVVAPVSITVNPGTLHLITGKSSNLSASATFGDGTTSDVTYAVNWSSTDSKIASVVNARVSGGIPGATTVSASIGTVKGSAAVTVDPGKLVDYFDSTQASGIDATLRISNPGLAGENLCAMVYVYAADQQLTECCGCQVTSNGLRTFSLNMDLTSNPLTGKIPARGTVEVVPAAEPVTGSICDASSSYTPSGILMMWATHLQTPTPGSPVFTESGSKDATLKSGDLTHLQTQCSFLQQAGSGQGVCSCGAGD